MMMTLKVETRTFKPGDIIHHVLNNDFIIIQVLSQKDSSGYNILPDKKVYSVVVLCSSRWTVGLEYEYCGDGTGIVLNEVE